MSYLDKVFEKLTKKIQSFRRFKSFQHFPDFVMCYSANSKRLKGGKTQKTSIPWQINKWDFHDSKLVIQIKNFQQVPFQQRIFQQETMNLTQANSFGKVVFQYWCGILILKVTYMPYLGKAFESLTNKIEYFKKFRNFWHFWVFV